MSIKINKQFVDELEFPNIGQKIYRDCEITGFCVRVTPNSKTYIVDKKYNNKLHRVVIGSSNNISAAGARKKAQIVLAQIYSGEFVSKSKNNDAFNPLEITVGAALDIYLNKNAFKPKTVRQYNKYIDLYLQGWRERKIFDISKDELLNKFLDTSEVSPSSANGAISLIGTLWKYMHVLYSTDDKPIMKSNPVDIIAVTVGWNKIAARERHLSQNVIFKYYQAVIGYFDELNLEDTARSNTHRDIILFVMYTGCRRVEACSLRWENVDLENGCVTFDDTKNGKRHLLPLGDHLISVLKSRFLLKENDWVFPATKLPTAWNIHATTIDRTLKRIGEEVGFYVSTHDFRRTFATLCNLLRFNIYVTKRLLNHTAKPRVDVTGGYVQIPMEELRFSMNMIEAVYQQKIDCFNYENVWNQRLQELKKAG
jgi:integrase